MFTASVATCIGLQQTVTFHFWYFNALLYSHLHRGEFSTFSAGTANHYMHSYDYFLSSGTSRVDCTGAALVGNVSQHFYLWSVVGRVDIELPCSFWSATIFILMIVTVWWQLCQGSNFSQTALLCYDMLWWNIAGVGFCGKIVSCYNSSSVCLFVPYILRGPLTDLRQTWWVYVGWPPICPWGVLFRKGQRVTFAFHYIIYVPASRHTLQRRLLRGKQQSLMRRLLLCCMSTTYVGGPGNCYWGVLFLKGQRVDGSTGQTGQWVTFTFTILYMIADDARLTPPHCKKHTGSTGWRVNRSTGQRVTITFTILYMIADDARLTPPGCKKHTASLLARRVNFLVSLKVI